MAGRLMNMRFQSPLEVEQEEAFHVLTTRGLPAYETHLQTKDILDFLNKAEKNYFASLNSEDFSSSDEEDDDDNERGITVEVFELGRHLPKVVFSPGIIGEITELITECLYSIKIAVYIFTEVSIFETILINKMTCNPRVDIIILVDQTQFDEFLEMAKKVIMKYFECIKIGIKVLDINKKNRRKYWRTGKAHEKFMIVDDSTALSGSFNFTWSAENINYEHVIISDDEAIVSPLLKRFHNLSEEREYQIL